MAIKITGLSVKKDTEKVVYTSKKSTHSINPLSGDLELEISHHRFKGHSSYSLDSVSEELQEKLYNVLVDIENELISMPKIGIKEEFAYDDVSNTLHIKGNVEFSDAKVKQPEESETHDTEKDELEQFENMLENIVKTFGTAINVGVKTNLTSQDISGILKELKFKGFNLL